MKLDATVLAHEYTIREIDPNDSWDAGEYGLEIYGVTLGHSPEYGFEIDCEPGDTVIVLVEHYRDGSTFGSNEYVDVKGIFKSRDEAERFAATINTDHGYFGYFIDFLYMDAVVPKVV